MVTKRLQLKKEALTELDPADLMLVAGAGATDGNGLCLVVQISGRPPSVTIWTTYC